MQIFLTTCTFKYSSICLDIMQAQKRRSWVIQALTLKNIVHCLFCTTSFIVLYVWIRKSHFFHEWDQFKKMPGDKLASEQFFAKITPVLLAIKLLIFFTSISENKFAIYGSFFLSIKIYSKIIYAIRVSFGPYEDDFWLFYLCTNNWILK